MVEPRRQAGAAGADGFTLIEMLVALSILTVGVSTLLLALSDSIALRNSADARLLAAQAVEDLVHRVATEGIQRKDSAATDLDVDLVLPSEIAVAGYSTLRLQPTMETDAAQPMVFLLRVRAIWLDEGQTVEEEFLRVLPRQLPLGARVQRFRKEHGLEK